MITSINTYVRLELSKTLGKLGKTTIPTNQ